MSTTTFFFIFIPLLALILLGVNLVFAPHKPYQEKDSTFECGFHSFLGQNRTQFSISFFIFALLFLLFDLEILLMYPYAVSAYTNSIYGLVIMLVFFIALTLGFAFEINKNALKIDSKQMFTIKNLFNLAEFIPKGNNFVSLPIQSFFVCVVLMADKASSSKGTSLSKETQDLLAEIRSKPKTILTPEERQYRDLQALAEKTPIEQKKDFIFDLKTELLEKKIEVSSREENLEDLMSVLSINKRSALEDLNSGKDLSKLPSSEVDRLAAIAQRESEALVNSYNQRILDIQKELGDLGGTFE